MIDLQGLASFIKIRNVVDGEIARLIGRPAHAGHIGEYVAAAIFDIKLASSASHTAIDGHFRSGPFVGKSVNIKFGTRREAGVSLIPSQDPADHPEFYLVLTGPDVEAMSSKGLSAPWLIRQVYLFETADLLAKLAIKGVQPSGTTSVRAAIWANAMMYPQAVNPRLVISDEQRRALELFWGID